MYQTLNANQVIDLLVNDEYANWSYQGAINLTDILLDLEAETGQPCELDLSEIRGRYSEYESIADAVNDLSMDADRLNIVSRFENGIIIQH